MLRILIADDHDIFRQGLKKILAGEYPSAYIEDVGDSDDLIKKGTKENWDLIISDFSMPGMTGIEALQLIKQTHPKLPCIVLSIYPEEHYALRALKAGVSGYLNKTAASAEVIKAVNTVLMGRKYITAKIAEKLVSQLGYDPHKEPHELLSDREFEVFKRIAAGESISEIAAKLFISPSTISTYRGRILEKMGLKTNADLTLYAIEQKFI
ncbi:MAG TPA: response regulator transcription factor [Puia sp.]|nr:response regulator transcription factor [Puia sp.]